MPESAVRRSVSILALTAAIALCVPGGAANADGVGAAPNSANLPGGTWASIAKLPDMSGVYELARGAGTATGRRTSKPVFTPAAQAELAAYKAAQAKGGEQDKQTANCLPPGMPGIMDQPYPIEILMTPGVVTVIQEAYTQVRHIHTDGRKQSDDPDLTFNGTSVGHWEGDTLVVDTVGFTPDAILQDGVQHSPKEHIVEWFRLVDPNTLEIRTRIEDPGVLAQPLEYTSHYARHRDWDIAEYVCEQNNRNSVDPNGKAGIRLGN